MMPRYYSMPYAQGKKGKFSKERGRKKEVVGFKLPLFGLVTTFFVGLVDPIDHDCGLDGLGFLVPIIVHFSLPSFLDE